jgi:hypothetical protein
VHSELVMMDYSDYSDSAKLHISLCALEAMDPVPPSIYWQDDDGIWSLIKIQGPHLTNLGPSIATLVSIYTTVKPTTNASDSGVHTYSIFALQNPTHKDEVTVAISLESEISAEEMFMISGNLTLTDLLEVGQLRAPCHSEYGFEIHSPYIYGYLILHSKYPSGSFPPGQF